MTSSQRRPNVHLIGNPAVTGTDFCLTAFQAPSESDQMSSTQVPPVANTTISDVIISGAASSNPANKHFPQAADTKEGKQLKTTHY